MIPAAFDYVRAILARSSDRPAAARSRRHKLVAGGHTLIPTLKLRLATPDALD